jgi:hypothetical protein
VCCIACLLHWQLEVTWWWDCLIACLALETPLAAQLGFGRRKQLELEFEHKNNQQFQVAPFKIAST